MTNTRPASSSVLSEDVVEHVISAWALAHDIDGAARNDLFTRLRSAAPRSDEPVAKDSDTR